MIEFTKSMNDIDIKNIYRVPLYMKNGKTKVLNVEPNIARSFIGDLRGLFLYYDIPDIDFPINMELNGYKSSSEYDGKKSIFKIVVEHIGENSMELTDI